MRKREQVASSGGGGFKPRLGAKAIAAMATFSLVASMCPGTAALAYANGQLAADGAGIETQALSVQAETVGANTHEMKDGVTYWVVGETTVGPDGSGNGIRVAKGAKVFLDIAEGARLNVYGKNADGNGVGYAAILLPEGSTLVVSGKGTLNATGGNAGKGANGGKAGNSAAGDTMRVGAGGGGGAGAGGAGAGIGTNGGAGGRGGSGGSEYSIAVGVGKSNTYGNDGGSGANGYPAASAGTLIVAGDATVNAKGGAAGEGGSGGGRGRYDDKRYFNAGFATGTSGGGGGGAGGSAADGIGSGGTGGGGGGGGASANIDGEYAMFYACDLDDLWGHGGSGGSGAWGGGTGSHGDEGASSDGDDTGASKKYAKAGGAGGSSAVPRTAAFYTYKDSSSAKPNCTSTDGNGGSRNATDLGNLEAFKAVSGITSMVSGGTFVYNGKEHGASVGAKLQGQSADAAALRSQAEGDAQGEWPDLGTLEVDGVQVDYKIAYYDEAGAKLDSAPVMPGRYAAVVTFTSERSDYCGDWVEPIVIAKRQVAKPTPKALTFDCENWYTGEGFNQDAFPGIDADVDGDGEPDFEFVKSAKSVRSARVAGSYQACFRLKDPETCQWEGESEDADEVWVPWSIALAEFDPNSAEITYWGASYKKAKTSVTYSGKPVWVRPWYAYTKNTDGRFPTWFTHWGPKDRPTTDRNSAAVIYLKGNNDYDGLVGYHEKADGSLEPVTAIQVYAWMFGVEIGGKTVPVESGDKVWYETDKDGWKVPLKVGGKKPKGAEGHVVARDLAYATHLGVMDAGTYQAYAYFDSGAGFAPTGLAETTVKVAKAKQAIKAKKKASVTVKAKKSGATKTLAENEAVNLKEKAKVSAKAKVQYEKANKAGGTKIVANKKTGKVTLKKGLAAGTYKVEVKLTAAASKNYKAAKPKTITLTVKVK